MAGRKGERKLERWNKKKTKGRNNEWKDEELKRRKERKEGTKEVSLQAHRAIVMAIKRDRKSTGSLGVYSNECGIRHLSRLPYPRPCGWCSLQNLNMCEILNASICKQLEVSARSHAPPPYKVFPFIFSFFSWSHTISDSLCVLR